MTAPFESFFRSREHARDTYLSRLFALFSEQVVRVWCMCPQAPYEDIGRPTLYEPGVSRGSTLDFTLRDRASGRTFVSELKCELEYDNYRYLRLTHASQLAHPTSTAFQRLLLAAKEPPALG
ncbi:MAG TPA: hypothetical protein VGR22_05745, partial [Thermomicrobiales bacterium]|nr:hypothetical protein [Thermomicrobiales bacterium]